MTHHCCVPGCKQTAATKYTKNGEKLSFHNFPREAHMRMNWISNIQREVGVSIHVKAASKVCSTHFEAGCFAGDRRRPDTEKLTTLTRRNLQKHALPTRFFWCAPASQVAQTDPNSSGSSSINVNGHHPLPATNGLPEAAADNLEEVHVRLIIDDGEEAEPPALLAADAAEVCLPPRVHRSTSESLDHACCACLHSLDHQMAELTAENDRLRSRVDSLEQSLLQLEADVVSRVRSSLPGV